MLTRDVYIEQSLRMNLVFLRLSKEHSFFLESSFTPRNTNLTETAAYYRRQFNWLLQETVGMANGMLDKDVLQSGQIITPYTLQAELLTQLYTGAVIDTALTREEAQIQPGSVSSAPGDMEARFGEINQRALAAATALASFDERLIADVRACRLFLNMYPLLMDHILRETMIYIGMLMKLQNRVDLLREQSLMEQQVFWNRILGDHAAFTRGMLDPTEQSLSSISDQFAEEMYKLSDAGRMAEGDPAIARAVTRQSLQAAQEFLDFGTGIIQSMMQCGIRSVLLPLAVDHDVREANFYNYQMLNTKSKISV